MKTNKQTKRMMLDVAGVRWMSGFIVFGRAEKFLRYTSTVSLTAEQMEK